MHTVQYGATQYSKLQYGDVKVHDSSDLTLFGHATLLHRELKSPDRYRNKARMIAPSV